MGNKVKVTASPCAAAQCRGNQPHAPLVEQSRIYQPARCSSSTFAHGHHITERLNQSEQPLPSLSLSGTVMLGVSVTGQVDGDTGNTHHTPSPNIQVGVNWRESYRPQSCS